MMTSAPDIVEDVTCGDSTCTTESGKLLMRAIKASVLLEIVLHVTVMTVSVPKTMVSVRATAKNTRDDNQYVSDNGK